MARCVTTMVSAIRARVRARPSFANATWFVASAILSFSPASIITERRTRQRASSHSVWPTKPGRARATCAFDTGAVVSAAASPRRTASKAASRYASCAAPAAGAGRPGLTAAAGSRVTATSAPSRGSGAPRGTTGSRRPASSRAKRRGSPKTSGATSSRSARSAAAVTSAPIPEGSPRLTAMLGRRGGIYSRSSAIFTSTRAFLRSSSSTC